MNSHPVFKLIDKKFILALDTIQKAYEQHPEKNTLSDNRIGLIISPNNRYTVKRIRKGEASLNHYQMLTFADHFNIPYEYFYYEELKLDFSFAKNDPSNFLSDINAKALDAHIDDKIGSFIGELEEKGHKTCDQVKEQLEGLKAKTVEKLKGVPFDKALSVLDTFFSLAFIELEKNSKPFKDKETMVSESNLTGEIDTNKLSYLENLVKSTQEMNKIKDQLIESKDMQIDLLTKDIKRLEKLLDKK